MRFDLRAALHRAFARNEPSLSGPIAVRFNGAPRRVYLQAKPLTAEQGANRSAIVFFFEGETLSDMVTGSGGIEERSPSEQVQQLQQELQLTQSQLWTSREDYEGANEELRAANEELQSVNDTARPPRSSKRARRSCSRSTRSCRRSTPN